jgi:hypothetical protein
MVYETLTLKVPADEMPKDLKPRVETVLTELVLMITTRLLERRRERIQQLVDILTQDVEIRELDARQARMRANAVRAVLSGAEWLTAETIGKLGEFSKSNLAAPANRWKKEGKTFAILHQGQDRFPRYALDETYRPLPSMEPILAILGPVSSWSIAAWFESTNGWLKNRRPRDMIATDPRGVLRAAERFFSSGDHG